MEFPLLIFAYLLISALIVVSIYSVRKGKSSPIQGQVLFQESLTYGRHLTGPLGVFGSQANSLEVTLTDKYFYIRPFFPFNLVNLGLEWIVPLQEIFDIEVLKKNFLSPNRIQLTFHDAKGKIQKIEFKVSNPERFLEAMELAQGTRFHFLQAEKCAYLQGGSCRCHRLDSMRQVQYVASSRMLQSQWQVHRFRMRFQIHHGGKISTKILAPCLSVSVVYPGR